MVELPLPTQEDTLTLGRRLGRAAVAETALALIGDLGAGKTALVRGLAEGLGVETRVVSPTFVLVSSHEGGRLPLWHADLYRLSSRADVRELGLRELSREGVLAVEWADRAIEELPADHLRIDLSDDPKRGAPEGGRVAHLSATGPRHRRLLEALVLENAAAALAARRRAGQ